MDEDSAIKLLKAKWSALPKLDLLAPVKLTDDDFAVILAARNETANRAVAERMPMIVARFRKAAQKEIMRHARKRTPYMQSEKFARRYASDIEKINTTLFGEDAWFTRGPNAGLGVNAYVGRFIEPITGELHADGFRGFCYAARLNDLPLLCIKGQDSMNAPEKTRELIMDAQNPYTSAGERARAKLRKREKLVPVPLGKVVMMLNYENPYAPGGTLHCSSPVPEEGAVSAFFRADWSRARRPLIPPPSHP